jgi:predicted enzyme related to lactoylglutathione lyase
VNVPLIEKIENITFPVKDIKKSVAFYESIGLKKSQEWSNYATFDLGGVIFGLDSDPKAELQIYMHVDDVDKMHSALKAKGVKFLTEPKDQYWGGRTALFTDLDGNKFILVSFKK